MQQVLDGCRQAALQEHRLAQGARRLFSSSKFCMLRAPICSTST